MLMPDETVLYHAVLHWIIYGYSLTAVFFGLFLWNYGTLIAVFIMGEAAASYVALPVSIIAVGIVAIACMNLFFVFIRHISTQIIVTNERVIYKHRLIAKEVRQTTLPKIASVDIEQTYLGALLGYGTVHVKGSGADLPPIDHVENPYGFYYAVTHSARIIEHPELGEAAPMEKTSAEKLAPPTRKLNSPSQDHDEEHEHAAALDEGNVDHGNHGNNNGHSDDDDVSGNGNH
jgi:hypothetical protein